MSPATSDFLGKTVRLALSFACIGLGLITADAVYFQGTSDHLSYVPEFMALLSTMFVATAGKNAFDNYTVAKTSYSSSVSTGPLPAAPVKQN